MGSNDHLHEERGFVPQRKMGPGYRSDATGFHAGEIEDGEFHRVECVIYTPPTPDTAMVGVGGAPTRATTLPTGSDERKTYPVASGVLDYFPDAIAAVAHLSWVGNQKHNPGQPLHWARGKSADEADTLLRHFLQRGTVDDDGVRHSAKVAWRALAMLQKEIETSRLP